MMHKFCSILLTVLFLAACVPVPVNAVTPTPDLNVEDPTMAATETSEPAREILPTQLATVSAVLPEGLQPITADNVQDVSEVASIQPDFPEYYQLSPDGRVGARADLTSLDVVDMETGEMLADIPVDLPDCEYGMDRFFAFNRTGTFLALVSRTAIQVWQVGGGLIYELPFDNRYNTDEHTCGLDMPQLALSPDASLLAVSGVEFSSTSARQYFRVIRIAENQVIYDWDGSDDGLHGTLNDFSGLGFSSDGSVLQTFDSTRYNAFSGGEMTAFRFWSVENWLEMDRNSASIANGFNVNELLYPLQANREINIKSRLDGQVKASLTGLDCTQIYPCDVKLSPQAKTAAVLNLFDDTLQYHREILGTTLEVWDLQANTRLEQVAAADRNVDGIRIDDDGGIQTVRAVLGGDVALDAWWASAANFDGLLTLPDGLVFQPQSIRLVGDDDCYYCGACSLDLQSLTVSCREAYPEAQGGWVSLDVEDEQFTVQTEDGEDVQIDLPAEFNVRWNVRFLGYSDQYQTAFYCLDKDHRSQACLIADGLTGEIIAQPEDIYALRFSPDGNIGAYIDREEKALFLFDLTTGKLSKMSAYQSRAWAVNPVFSADGTELVYMVQNLKNEEVLSLEWLDPAEQDVLRRTNLDVEELDEPSVLAVGADNDLVALGDQAGWIYVLDKGKGKLLHSWQAGYDSLIGLAFSAKDDLLVSLDEEGQIRLWGLNK